MNHIKYIDHKGRVRVAEEPAEQVDAPTIDKQLLVWSLASDLCPACGKHKMPRKSVCGACWYRLPRHTKRRLYLRIGQGYEYAFAMAMKSLGVEKPTMPRLPMRIPQMGDPHPGAQQ